MWRSKGNLGTLSTLFLWDKVSHWPGTCHIGQTVWSVNPKDPPCLLSAGITRPHFHSQQQENEHRFLEEPSRSQPQIRKHFTNRAIFPAPAFLFSNLTCFAVVSESSVFSPLCEESLLVHHGQGDWLKPGLHYQASWVWCVPPPPRSHAAFSLLFNPLICKLGKISELYSLGPPSPYYSRQTLGWVNSQRLGKCPEKCRLQAIDIRRESPWLIWRLPWCFRK